MTVSVKGDRSPVTIIVSVDCLQRRCNCYNKCGLFTEVL